MTQPAFDPTQEIACGDFIAYHARARGRSVACVDLAANRQLTYSELDGQIAQCAGYLRSALACPQGARVAILARNGLDILVLHFACIRAGTILQPLNWRLSGPELRAQVLDAAPEVFLYQTEFEAAATQAIESTSARRVLRLAPDSNELALGMAAAEPCRESDTCPDAPVTLLYTSGTTGKPKGVIVTQRNAWATAFNFATVNGVTPGDVLLCDMPLFHVAGLFGVARAALFVGATVLISDRFVPETALQRMSDPALGITHYFAVPQMAMAMLQDPTYAKSDLTRLKALVIGGAPLPKSVVERLLADGVMPIEGYGLSEAGTVFGVPLERETVARKAGHLRRAAAMLIEARLVDSEDRDVSGGRGRRDLAEGAQRHARLLEPAGDHREVLPGWLVQDGRRRAPRRRRLLLQIVDRWKDMYISGGENVYPAEIESVLAEHAARLPRRLWWACRTRAGAKSAAPIW